jgi:uncharacterized membrane protein YbhN (UPF0104 family)
MEEQQKPKKKKKHKKRNLAIRIIISIILIIFFASTVDLKETFSIILGTNYWILIGCLALYLVGQSVSAYKWSIISKAIGFKKTYVEYLQYYFIGMFFNLFLPSTIGGDVGKAYYLSKGDVNGRKAPAIYTVLAERFSGLTVLSWLGTIALLTPVGDKVPFIIKIIAICMSLSIVIGAPLFPWFIRTFFSDQNWLNKSLLRDVLVFWEKTIVLKALGWSLVFHSIIIIIHMLIGISINLDVSLLYYIAVYPIVAIIGFVPVAFNGIGVREGAYIYFFGLAGVDKNYGFAFGILWFAIIVISSLIGGIVYIKGHHSPPDVDEQDFSIDSISRGDNSKFVSSS